MNKKDEYVKNKVQNFFRKYWISIIIIIISLIFAGMMASQKEGFHMDEILAYELSNAEFNPWIVPTQPQGRLAKFDEEYLRAESFFQFCDNLGFIIEDTLKNKENSILLNYSADIYDMPVFIDRQTFIDYLEVNDKDAFNYASVYFNLKNDNHPPLYFMLLHTISSFFQNSYSIWIGISINLFVMGLTLWFLGKICDLCYKKKIYMYLTMLMFGFSTGMVASTTWIRMYALFTMFLVCTLYLHLKAYKENTFVRIKKNGKKKWIGSRAIFTVTILAFLTQYFSLFFILPLALVMVIVLIRDGKKEAVIAYIKTMVLSGIVGVMLNPFSITDVLFSGRGKEALTNLGNGLVNFLNRFYGFFKILAVNISVNEVVLAVIILLFICFKLGWREYKKERKNDSVDTSIKEEIKIENNSMKINQLDRNILAMITIPLSSYFVLASKMSPYIVDRYIMAIFPLGVFLVVYMVKEIIEIVARFLNKNKKLQSEKLSCIVVIILIFISLFINYREYPYLYKGYENQLEIASKYKDYPLVCHYDGYGFYENVPEMMEYKESILLKSNELDFMDESRIEVTKDGYVAMIKYHSDTNASKEVGEIMRVFGGSEAELLLEQGVFGDTIYLITP